MAKKKVQAQVYSELKSDALAKTGAIIGFIGWVVGLGWHGGLGQPSMMMQLYNVPYMNMTMQGSLLVAFVVSGFVLGWLTATIYNWALKK